MTERATELPNSSIEAKAEAYAATTLAEDKRAVAHDWEMGYRTALQETQQSKGLPCPHCTGTIHIDEGDSDVGVPLSLFCKGCGHRWADIYGPEPTQQAFDYVVCGAVHRPHPDDKMTCVLQAGHMARHITKHGSSWL